MDNNNHNNHNNYNHNNQNHSNHKKFMERAIELSRHGSIIEKAGGVFGAVIVDKHGKIIGEGYNQVIKHNDPTWHAEMQAIREAAKHIGNPHLDDCILYTSAESCPMCLAAAHWAHIQHIYSAATYQDALKYGDFQDVNILDELRKDSPQRKIKNTEIMRPESVEVWKEFAQMPDRARY